jgi:hypothetical protein
MWKRARCRPATRFARAAGDWSHCQLIATPRPGELKRTYGTNGMRPLNADILAFKLSHWHRRHRKRSKHSLQRLDSWEQPQLVGVVIFGDMYVGRVIVLARQENVFSTTVVLTIVFIPKRCLPHKPCSTSEGSGATGAEQSLCGNGDRVIDGR